MKKQDQQQREESHRESHVMVAHAQREEEDQPHKGILPSRPPDPDIAEQDKDHHQADMQRVEALADGCLGPDGNREGKSKGRFDGEDCGRQFCQAHPARAV